MLLAVHLKLHSNFAHSVVVRHCLLLVPEKHRTVAVGAIRIGLSDENTLPVVELNRPISDYLCQKALCDWQVSRWGQGSVLFSGNTAIQAIEREDLILVQAIVFTAAISVVLINIAMDFVYKLIDPRLKLN